MRPSTSRRLICTLSPARSTDPSITASTASSARQALSLLDRHPVEVMLVDSDLTVTGGYELFSQLLT